MSTRWLSAISSSFLVEIGTAVCVYKIASSEKANWFHIFLSFDLLFPLYDVILGCT